MLGSNQVPFIAWLNVEDKARVEGGCSVFGGYLLMLAMKIAYQRCPCHYPDVMLSSECLCDLEISPVLAKDITLVKGEVGSMVCSIYESIFKTGDPWSGHTDTSSLTSVQFRISARARRIACFLEIPSLFAALDVPTTSALENQ